MLIVGGLFVENFLYEDARIDEIEHAVRMHTLTADFSTDAAILAARTDYFKRTSRSFLRSQGDYEGKFHWTFWRPQRSAPGDYTVMAFATTQFEFEPGWVEVVLYVDFTVNGETGEVSHRIFRDRSRVTELGEDAR